MDKKNSNQATGGCCGVIFIAVIGFGVWGALSGGGSGSRANADYPNPGSYADKLCDVHPADEPDAVLLRNGKWYDPDCLDSFPWDEQVR